MEHLSHDILLLIQVVDSQLTEIWHKRSGIVSRAHGIHRHSSEVKVDTLEVDDQLVKLVKTSYITCFLA